MFSTLKGMLSGLPLAVTVEDGAMRPYLVPGDLLTVRGVEASELFVGDMVYCRVNGRHCIRRYDGMAGKEHVRVVSETDDAAVVVPSSEVLARVINVRRHGRAVKHRGVGVEIA